MGCAVLRSAESIRRRDRAGTPWCSVRGSGGHDLHDYASTSLWAPGASCGDRRRGAQRAHAVVAQSVEDELKLAAGGGDNGDVVSSPLGDTVTELVFCAGDPGFKCVAY